MKDSYLILLLSYFIGSIPSGLIFSFLAGHGDIRKIGSGNIGTTNVLRTGSKKLAALTLLADSIKIVLAIKIGLLFNFANEYQIGFCSLMGHMFPVWLRFKGGKGIASFLGLSIYLFPQLAAILALTWVTVFYISRYSSLASIITALIAIVYLLVNQPKDSNLALMILSVLIILFKHRSNIIRLIKGEELKFGKKHLKC